MVAEVSLRSSKQLATGPYPELIESGLYNYNLPIKIRFNIILPFTSMSEN
jgi:hypothetical protein